MSLDNPSIIGFLTSLFFLLGLFLYAFFYIIRKQWNLNRREQELDKRVVHEIKDAHLRAEALLNEAAVNAKKIISETTVFKERTEKDISTAIELETGQYRKLLDSKLQKVISAYEQIFLKSGEIYALSIRNFHTKMLQAQDEKTKKFSDTLDDESLNAKFYLQRRVNEEVEQVKHEIDAYKKQEQQRVADSLKQLMKKLALEAFEGELTSEQQEKILFKALEKAKDQQFFD